MAARNPTLILMPCTTSGVAEEQIFAQGFTDDLQVELARFGSLDLVCWQPPAALETPAPETPVANQSGKAFVLRTALRRTDSSLRITAGLSESRSDRHVWSQRYEAPAAELFAIEDNIVAQTAVALATRLEDAVLLESRSKAIENLEAYELWIRGKSLLLKGTAEDDAAARVLFERAIALDPHFARAYGGLALSWFNEWTCQFWHAFDANGEKAYKFAHQALALDDTDPLLHVVIARILLHRRDFDQAAWYVDRALALSPNHPDCLIQLALCHALLGNHDASIRCAERAFRLHPFHPQWYSAYASVPYLLARRIDQAIEFARSSLDVPVVDLPAALAIGYVQKGQMEEARHWYGKFEALFRAKITGDREARPGEAIDWLLSVNPLRQPEDIRFVREAIARIDASKSSPAAPVVPNPEPAKESAMLRQGAGWMLSYAGQSVLLPDMKGLQDIRVLIRSAGTSIHCFDLSGHVKNAGKSDQVLDDKARSGYKAPIRELQEELAEAEDSNDLGRSERAQAELDSLLEALSDALGLGGRSRRLGCMAERARTTVTWRIRYAIKKIETVHAPLGRHLRKAIRTGLFCCYQPETPVKWRLADKTDPAKATLAG
jgi:TolB-like protein